MGLGTPVEMVVRFDVPRDRAESWLQFFQEPRSLGNIVPANFSSASAIIVDADHSGQNVRLDVIFRPTPPSQ